MNRNAVVGLCVGIVGAVVVVGLAFTLAYNLLPNHKEHELPDAEKQISQSEYLPRQIRTYYFLRIFPFLKLVLC